MERLASRSVAFVSAAEARSRIAEVFLAGSSSPSDSCLGSIELQPHQVEATGRLERAIAEFGGALLCDPVGTGKTFCALAIAARYSHPVVVAPAVLAPMWRQSARDASVAFDFISHESLSRHAALDPGFDFVIVDEAHHARNPATRRFASLSRLAAGKDVLLLSATPIHNRLDDLHALLSLFLGERASSLTDAELGRCIIRRSARRLVSMPSTEALVWCDIPRDDRFADEILALPPPLPPRDGGDGGVLVIHSLIRQWASSDAALREALRRRKLRAIALIAALESGTYPSRAELAAWSAAEDCVQLAFAGLIAPAAGETSGLLAAIRSHRDGLTRLLELLEDDSQRDSARAALIRAVRARHANSSTVVFSQYADTVNAMFARLAPDGGVAALSGAGGRVAGGRISRNEVIGSFAPDASQSAHPSRANVITLLLTTDLLSEGVNLQDANVVIHLDLPWTPARMEQRLGRVARLGSRHERVHSYAIHPPASAESIVRIESVLASKMTAAAPLVTDFPSLKVPDRAIEARRDRPRDVEMLRQRLRAWAGESQARAVDGIAAACVTARTGGFVAAYTRGGNAALLCSSSGRISDDPLDVLESMEAASCPEVPIDEQLVREVLTSISDHLEASASLGEVRPSRTSLSRSLETALRRVSATVRSSRQHRRARMTSLADEARRIVLGRSGAHRERAIAAVLSRHLPDEEFLQALADLKDDESAGPLENDLRIEAAIVFVAARDAIALSGAKES